MSETLPIIREWRGVDPVLFHEEIRAYQHPVIMRGLVKNWPLVEFGIKDPANAAGYLADLYRGKLVGTITLPPSENGRIFYNNEIKGYNYQRTMNDLRAVLNYLLKAQGQPDAATVAVQAISAPEVLPGFEAEHPMPLRSDVAPNLWIGNQATVAPHYDLWDNIACVAVGRRRFTLFPPDQRVNLYVGPLENTPAGAPISMVDIASPDFERYPKFRQAMEHAQIAELNAGDAIYIPFMWWHGVQALAPFNILVNYWWNEHFIEEQVHPMHALMAARLAFQGMSQDQRELWREVFDHYIFSPPDDLMNHLPEHARGIFGSLDRAQLTQIRRMLSQLIAPI